MLEWICEAHPWLEWPHDDCAGPGAPKEEAQVTLFMDIRRNLLQRIAVLEPLS